MLPVQKTAQVAQEVGTWELWQITSISLMIIVPILTAVVLVSYFKYWKPRQEKKNGNNSGPPTTYSNGIAAINKRMDDFQVSINDQIGLVENGFDKVVDSLRETRKIGEKNGEKLGELKTAVVQAIAKSDRKDTEHRGLLGTLWRAEFKADLPAPDKD